MRPSEFNLDWGDSMLTALLSCALSGLIFLSYMSPALALSQGR